ncbi:MAG: class I SAM-dependent methyltransferase [Fuerstiella sp.]|nr:class I SAM-dependent methyltransferase [Fuerstiella sp.]
MFQITNILDHPAVYRLWQSPFSDKKLRLLKKYNALDQMRRVLDVGCGPGTNSSLFSHTDYLGLDLNDRYIEMARDRYKGRFEVADVRRYKSPTGATYDCILLNSFLHHIDDDNTASILANMSSLLSDDGYIHIIDLVLPKRASISRWLAQNDRGDYPRPLERWTEIFSSHFETHTLEAFPVGCFGVTLWNLVYFKGRRKDA